MSRVVWELYDNNGNIRLDLSRRLPKFLGYYLINPSNGRTGVITHPGFAGGKPFLLPQSWAGNFPGAVPRILLRATDIYYEYPVDMTQAVAVGVNLAVL